jgi:predicted transcriptional regulator/DNA-binding XRE family transcriptional regulator
MEKLYIGRKIKELREKVGLTQSHFAKSIGISPSYLNQIENNQRPVSAAIILQLAEKYNVNPIDLSPSASQRLLSGLADVLSDPLLRQLAVSRQDQKLIAQNVPNAARALMAMHEAYRRANEQLMLSTTNQGAASLLTPYDEVRDFFHFADNYFDSLDRSAEDSARSIFASGADKLTALVSHIGSEMGIETRFEPLEGGILRRMDKRNARLIINTSLNTPSRIFQLAYFIGWQSFSGEFTKIIAGSTLHSQEAKEIGRIGLANYFAGALALPYAEFAVAAKEARHDIELLSHRFTASAEQIAHRLSTLQRPGHKGIPIFFAKIDRAGNITKRHSASSLQIARYGAACPLWNAYTAFESRGDFVRQLAEMPDGTQYLSVATETSGTKSGYGVQRPRFAIVFGCNIEDAKHFVYAQGLDISARSAFEPIGVSCRVCTRSACQQRAVPPIQAALHFTADERRIIPYAIGAENA